MLIITVHYVTAMMVMPASEALDEVRNVHEGLDVAVGGVLDETKEKDELLVHEAAPFYLLTEAMCPLKP